MKNNGCYLAISLYHHNQSYLRVNYIITNFSDLTHSNESGTLNELKSGNNV